MRYPSLVQRAFCTTPIKLEIEPEELDPYGDPLERIEYSGFCNYQDGASRIFTDQKKIVAISGKALIPGDPCPAISVIAAGAAVVNGEKRRIASGRKCRNPDGTVNFTEVLLI